MRSRGLAIFYPRQMVHFAIWKHIHKLTSRNPCSIRRPMGLPARFGKLATMHVKARLLEMGSTLSITHEKAHWSPNWPSSSIKPTCVCCWKVALMVTGNHKGGKLLTMYSWPAHRNLTLWNNDNCEQFMGDL